MKVVLRLVWTVGILLNTVGLPVMAEKPNGLIVLLDDLGSLEFYVGAMKGSIYSAHPEARLDVITSEVPQGNIREGAYLLAQSVRDFPSGTLFCVVVGAQSGIKQRFIAVETEDEKYFVAPDNGVLTLVLRQSKIKKAHQIINPMFLRNPNALASPFPWKDIYGPAAAALARGEEIESAGPPASPLVAFEVIEPKLDLGELVGEVEHIDAQGNLLTNIPQSLVEKSGISPGKTVSVSVGSESLEAPFVKNYSDVHQGSWLVFVNNFEELQISRNQANANAFLQAHDGTVVKVHRKP